MIEGFVVHLHQAGLRAEAIQCSLSALRHHCRENAEDMRFDSPRIRLMLQGIRRRQQPSGGSTLAVIF